MSENQNNDKIIGAYKQTNILLIVVGVLLGSYTINGSGLYNLLDSIVALIVVLYGAYQYYKFDGKIGIFLLVIAFLWTVGYLLIYFKDLFVVIIYFKDLANKVLNKWGLLHLLFLELHRKHIPMVFLNLL